MKPATYPTANQAKTKVQGGAFDYQGIARRHMPQTPFLSLKDILLGLAMACLIAMLYHHHTTTALENLYATAQSGQPSAADPSPEQVPLAATKPTLAPDNKAAPATNPDLHAFAITPAKELAAANEDKPLARDRFLMERDELGQFAAKARINNSTDVLVVADTGASMVMLSGNTALRIGLRKGASIQVSTAAGLATHYQTRLATLSLGDIVLHNVQATISPDMTDDYVMLGMNVLGGLNMKVDSRGLELSNARANSNATADHQEEPQPFRQTLEHCMKPGNKFDRQTLDCLQGT